MLPGCNARARPPEAGRLPVAAGDLTAVGPSLHHLALAWGDLGASLHVLVVATAAHTCHGRTRQAPLAARDTREARAVSASPIAPVGTCGCEVRAAPSEFRERAGVTTLTAGLASRDDR